MGGTGYYGSGGRELHWNGRSCLHPSLLWSPPSHHECHQKRSEQGSSEDKHGQCNPVHANLTWCWLLVWGLDEEESHRGGCHDETLYPHPSRTLSGTKEGEIPGQAGTLGACQMVEEPGFVVR